MTSWTYTIPAAFLAGSIPFGLIIARAKGVDIRRVGSGNIGATNVGRALGRRYFFLCFALDFLKGFGPVLAAGWLAGVLGAKSIDPVEAWLWVAAMLAPVLGHVFSPWLKFRGGKGVATSLGALLAVWPHLTIPAVGVLAVFGIVLAMVRFMSLASMVGGLTLPLFVAGFWVASSFGPGIEPWQERNGHFSRILPFLAVSCLVAGLVVWAHRANIKRLRAGTEPRIGRRVSAS